jgi:hypothetical protein
MTDMFSAAFARSQSFTISIDAIEFTLLIYVSPAHPIFFSTAVHTRHDHLISFAFRVTLDRSSTPECDLMMDGKAANPDPAVRRLRDPCARRSTGHQPYRQPPHVFASVATSETKSSSSSAATFQDQLLLTTRKQANHVRTSRHAAVPPPLLSPRRCTDRSLLTEKKNIQVERLSPSRLPRRRRRISTRRIWSSRSGRRRVFPPSRAAAFL